MNIKFRFYLIKLIINPILIFNILIFGCTAPEIPYHENPKYPPTNFTLRVLPIELIHKTKNNKSKELIEIEEKIEGKSIITLDSAITNEILIDIVKNSTLFSTVFTENVKDSIKYDFELHVKHSEIEYNENPSVQTFFHPYNILSYLVFAGGIAITQIDQAPAGIGALGIGLGALGFIGTTFLFKSEYNHNFSSNLSFKLIETKNKTIICKKDIFNDFSEIYSHHIEEPAGTTYFGPIEVAHINVYNYDIEDVNTKLGYYTFAKLVEEMLDEINKKLKD